MAIPPFTALDTPSSGLLLELAARWRDSPQRPRVAPDVLARWRQLIEAWCDDRSLPLLIRRAALKGTVAHHEASGRELLYVDNSPANWSLASALLGRLPTIGEVGASLVGGVIPIGMVKLAPGSEGSPYRGLLRAVMDPPNLNTLGWKVCHILPVGTSDRTPATRVPLETLREHHRRLLDPANMFLVPKVYAGLGEVPEFINGFQTRS